MMKRKELLNFLYWREKEIHPADAEKIVSNYLNKDQTSLLKKAFPNWSNFKNWSQPEQIFTVIFVIAFLMAILT